MPDLRVQCPHCDHSYTIDSQLSGRKGRCKHCREPFDLIAAREEPVQAEPGHPSTNPGPAVIGIVSGRIGRFEIREKLGSGGFGAVYLAYDPVLGREVALKVPHERSLENSQDKRRFLREAKAAAQLFHPNIVPVFDSGTDGPYHFIASQFVPGQTLAQAAEAGSFEPRQAARIAMQLADALHYAHSRGVVHRDMKPQNVLLNEHGEPHLTDFGLARLTQASEKLTHEDQTMGTPAYMSPEQVQGQDVGPASDQYSLGATLFELLCGRLPFVSDSLVNLFYQVIHKDPPPLSDLRAGLSIDIETICLKAIAKRTEDRYASCGDLADDIRRFLGDEPIRARSPGAIERLTRWCRRNPAVAGLSATVMLVLVLGVMISTFFAFRFNAKAIEARQNAEKALLAQTEASRSAAEAESKAQELQIQVQKVQAIAKLENEARERADRKTEEAEALAQSKQRETERANQEADRARTETGRARRLLYNTSVSLLQIARKDGRLDRVQELLDTQRPTPGVEDVRGWEWHYLQRLLNPNQVVLRLPVSSGDVDRQVLESWDMKTGREILGGARLRTKSSTMVFSLDGKRMAIVNNSGQVKVCDLQHRQELSRTTVPVRTSPVRFNGMKAEMLSIEFGPAGRLLAFESTIGLNVIDAETGKGVFSLEFAALSQYRSLGLLGDPPDRAEGWRPRNFAFGTRGTELTALVLVPNEDRLRPPRTGVATWNLRTGGLSSVIDLTENAPIPLKVNSAILNRTGTRVAAFVNGVRQVWDLTGKPVKQLQEIGNIGSSSNYMFNFSHHGKWLVLADRDGPVQVWDADTGQALITQKARPGLLNQPFEMTDIFFSADGNRLGWSYRDGTTRVYDFNRKQLLTTMKAPPREHPGGVAFTPDGTRLVAADSDRFAHVWQIATGPNPSVRRASARATGGLTLDVPPTPKGVEAHILSLAFSPDGSQLALLRDHRRPLGFDDTRAGQFPARLGVTVEIWNTTTGKPAMTRVEASDPNSAWGRQPYQIAYSADGSRLVMARTQRDDVISMVGWETRIGGQQFALKSITGTSDRPAYALNSAATMIATSSAPDSGCTVYDVGTLRKVATFKGPGGDVILTGLSFSRDGVHVAGFYDDGSVIVWNDRKPDPVMKTGKPGDLRTPMGRVDFTKGCFALSPDGRRYARNKGDSLVSVGAIPTGHEAFTLRGFTGPVTSLAFSPDGTRLVSGHPNGEVRVWDATTGQPLLDLDAHDGEGAIAVLAFAPDGSRLASAGAGDVVCIWDGSPMP